MKKLSFLLMLCIMLLSSQQMLADDSTTLVVTKNSNSGIQGANYTGSLDDGSILGFNISESKTSFCGAISNSNTLDVPRYISTDMNIEELISWDYNSESNIWKSVDTGSAFENVSFYFADSGWSKISDPAWSHDGTVWELTIPEGTGGSQWQAQFNINTNLQASKTKKYNFYCVVDMENSNYVAILIRLFNSNNDANYFFSGSYVIGSSSVFKAENISLPINDAQALSLLFDFGGTPPGTHIKISQIYLEETSSSENANIRMQNLDDFKEVANFGTDNAFDFSKAQSITKMSLPSTITKISQPIPSQITDLYLYSYTPPKLSSSDCISSNTKIWVGEWAYNYYAAEITNKNSNWYGKSVFYDGWENTMPVTKNSNSGIDKANYTGISPDGSILGFYYNYGDVYFCGAISNATSLLVPETININGSIYNVNCCGYYSDGVDFEEAKYVSSMTLPSTITKLYYVPWTITDLHLKSTAPPSLYNSYSIYAGTTIWVPQSAIYAYSSLTTNSNSYWYRKIVHYEGWEPTLVTVTVNTPGTFAQLLLNQIENWSDVDELTVIGKLNDTDLGYLSRLKNVTKIDLSQTDIKSITGCAGLYYLKTILLPSSVTSVAEGAFEDCSSLKEISLPNAVEIGGYAFRNCSSLSTVSLPAATTIGDEAFYYCSSLSTVSLPAATTIGDEAFYYCSSLSTVSLPAATTIGVEAFYYCSSLSTVSLPAATTIGSYAFHNCYSLSNVSLPAATTIGSGAFYDCKSLSYVSLPVATTIGSSAFRYCGSLSYVILPAAKTIGFFAFENCYSLAAVSLPNTLTNIGNDAFKGCINLTEVHCHVISPLTTTAFRNTGASMTTLHVPALAVNAYILHDDWYSFYKIVPIEEPIDNLIISSDFAITNHTGITSKPSISLEVVRDVYDEEFVSAGHLTIDIEGLLSLNNFVQRIDMTRGEEISHTHDEYDNCIIKYGIPELTSLIPNSEISADNVEIKLIVGTDQWYFLSFPFDVNVSDISYTDGTLWVIRKYSGEDRAKMSGNTWQNMTNGMTLKAGEGYILHCANETTDYPEFIFKATSNSNQNNIFTYKDQAVTLSTYASDLAHNRSWNLVGNPYPCYYDTRNIEHNGVITVWNGDGYVAYSLLDDQYVLRPNEAFFVQCPNDASGMKFKKEGRQHTPEASDNVSYAKAMQVAGATPRYVFNLTISGNEYTDKTRIVINENAMIDYEINCDASKFMSSNNAVPQIYVLENGQRFAIDERPLADGKIDLGAYFGETGEYTIALNNNPNSEWCIILKDNVTGKSVDLAKESYTFSATQGTNDSRFSVTIGNDATGIDNLKVNEANTDNIYNVNGQRISAPQRGINIINGKKTIVR